jgi:hypothetical protein
LLAFFLGSRIKCKFNRAVKIPTTHKNSEQSSDAGLSRPPSLLPRLPSLRKASLSLAYLLPCSHLSTSLKSNLSKRIGSYVKERLSQKPRSGPVQDLSYGDLDLSGNQKTAPQLFPRTIYVRPSSPLSRLSIPASELITAGIKEPECLLVYTTVVTETIKCPVTTRSRGSLLVCTSQMAAIEPAVLP